MICCSSEAWDKKTNKKQYQQNKQYYQDLHICEKEECIELATYFDYNESFCKAHAPKCEHCKKKLTGDFAAQDLLEMVFCVECQTLDEVLKLVEDEDPKEKQAKTKTKQTKPKLQDWEPTWSDGPESEDDMQKKPKEPKEPKKSDELTRNIEAPSKIRTNKQQTDIIIPDRL